MNETYTEYIFLTSLTLTPLLMMWSSHAKGTAPASTYAKTITALTWITGIPLILAALCVWCMVAIPFVLIEGAGAIYQKSPRPIQKAMETLGITLCSPVIASIYLISLCFIFPIPIILFAIFVLFS